jgi:hypothetical protein
MNIDTGLVVVIAAVLLFYLRLILIQRERARRAAPKPGSSQSKKGQPPEKPFVARYSILSPDRRDLVIAAAGLILILAGLLANIKVIPFGLAQAYWWIPVAAGIVAFSWGFK